MPDVVVLDDSSDDEVVHDASAAAPPAKRSQRGGRTVGAGGGTAVAAAAGAGASAIVIIDDDDNDGDDDNCGMAPGGRRTSSGGSGGGGEASAGANARCGTGAARQTPCAACGALDVCYKFRGCKQGHSCCAICSLGALKEQIEGLASAGQVDGLDDILRGTKPLLRCPVEGCAGVACAADVAAVLPALALRDLDVWLLKNAAPVLSASKVACYCFALEAVCGTGAVMSGTSSELPSAPQQSAPAGAAGDGKSKGKAKAKASGGKSKGKLAAAASAGHPPFDVNGMWAAMFGFPSGGAHPHDPVDGTGYGGSSRETCMGSSATKKAAERAKRDQNKSDKEAAKVATQLARAMEDPSRATRREWASIAAHCEAAAVRLCAAPALAKLLADCSLMEIAAGRRDAVVAALRVCDAACADPVHVRSVVWPVAREGDAVKPSRALLEHLRVLSAAAKVLRDNMSAAAVDKTLTALVTPAAQAAESAEAAERRWREEDGALSSELATAGPQRKRKRARDDEAKDEAYKQALASSQFEQVPLIKGHAFQAELQAHKPRGGGGSETERKRQARLAKEVAALATGLPLERRSGIFLRVDENRLDCLRALIIPAPDTPYAFGYFLFDIALPADYPYNPPKVKLLTTGGGRWRPNPNLYADGKVCLSLLGTWEGPKWDPKYSTLLQVLISIQSLIFVEQPYFNEPGFESMSATKDGQAEGDAYVRAQRVSSLRHAVLPALQKPPKHFEKVVKEHAKRNYGEMRRTLETWCKEGAEAAESGARSGKRGGGGALALLGGSNPFGSEDEFAESIVALSKSITSALDAYIAG